MISGFDRVERWLSDDADIQAQVARDQTGASTAFAKILEAKRALLEKTKATNVSMALLKPYQDLFRDPSVNKPGCLSGTSKPKPRRV